MTRSIAQLWYVWFFDLPRDLSAVEIKAVRQRMDARLEQHARWLSVATVVMVGGGGWVGGYFFNAWPAAWLMSAGFNRALANMAGAASTSLIGCALGGIAVFGLAHMLGRNTWIVEARKAVRDIGRDVCINCGYWLRGLEDEVAACPECGTQRAPMPKATGNDG